jgi:glycosyltransferase involved in cell wall biosynthesis
LIKTLRRWHQSPELWQTMSLKTREHFERKFEISHIVRQYDAVYNGMMKNEK